MQHEHTDALDKNHTGGKKSSRIIRADDGAVLPAENTKYSGDFQAVAALDLLLFHR